jgi:hypothetical protein
MRSRAGCGAAVWAVLSGGWRLLRCAAYAGRRQSDNIHPAGSPFPAINQSLATSKMCEDHLSR